MEKRAIWLSRHAATEAQLSEIAEAGYEVVPRLDLGGRNLASSADVSALKSDIICADVSAVYGVFAPPLQAAIIESTGHRLVPCFAAWNIMRTVEGEPAFKHLRFVTAGILKY